MIVCRILLLSRLDSLGASIRLRSYQYINSFKQQGLSVDISYLFSNQYITLLYQNNSKTKLLVVQAYLKRLFFLLKKAREYDVLWVEKELFPGFPGFFEKIGLSLGVPYVVDYDDAVFHNYDKSSSYFVTSLKKPLSYLKKLLLQCSNLNLQDTISWTEFVVEI